MTPEINYQPLPTAANNDSMGLPMSHPTYLRIVATTRCNLSCSYCHGEGDTSHKGELAHDTLIRCLEVAATKGIRKFKFLGGDPLIRSDLPDIIAKLRNIAPDADISLITAGSQRANKVDNVFSAGLDRINFSIHGFTESEFANRQSHNTSTAKLYQQRTDFIERVMTYDKPCKVNYVYTGKQNDADINGLLDWAADKPVIVNILDDLNNPNLNADVLLEVLMRLRGAPLDEKIHPDPDSLATKHFSWRDGLQVELKHKQLGNMLAYAACPSCPKRQQCREGIYALRLFHTGNLHLCMDRPDINFPLADIINNHGILAGEKEWDKFFNQEMNDGKNHISYNRRPRRGENHDRTDDCKIIRMHFPNRARGANA